MASRRQNRELAFQVLYSLSFSPARDEDALRQAFALSPRNLEKNDQKMDASGSRKHDAQDESRNDSQGNPRDRSWDFAWDLVRGVWSSTGELDELINQFSHNWRADRMGKIELTLMRLALYELYWRSDTPPLAIINEAVELAEQFGVPGSRQLINGILNAAIRAPQFSRYKK